MKNILIAFLLVVCSATVAMAQADADTVPQFKKTEKLPPFRIQLTNNQWFGSHQLKNKPTLVLYFNPDCGHCQVETEDLLSRMNTMKNLQVVMITSRSVADTKNFSDHYMLQKFSAVTIGSDTTRYVSRFFDVKFTPFSALYNKDGRLVKVWENGIDFAELSELL